MIPAGRPNYSYRELKASVIHSGGVIEDFERELASHFGVRHAITFPYGRSALYAALKALNRPEGEVVQPAYNCVVVAHATVAAGHRPVFVDTSVSDPNQDMERMVKAIGPETVAVIPTSIYGVTFDAEGLCEEICSRNRGACILIDCCQALDACWEGNLLLHAGDGALLAFGIGKPMTTLYGGALLTNRPELAAAVRAFRDRTYRTPRQIVAFRRWFYFIASWIAMSTAMTSFTDYLINADTSLSRYLWKLRAREAIRLPEDNDVLMLPLEAAIGRRQVERVSGFMARRGDIAGRYNEAFRKLPNLELLPWEQGSTFAIYTVRLKKPSDRDHVIALMRRGGVQCGTILSYVIPGLECYQERGFSAEAFPHARAWSESVLNIPNHPSMTDRQVQTVIRVMEETFGVLYG
ncbi:MAG: DegT/DnrJ/EryC1/StrS aminotransferase family protein [Syntrophales bacterium]|jgi:dTDP-4-amino-4,6-dideoxygalactose transaminase